MEFTILTTYKDHKRKWGTDRTPNLDIKQINGKPFKAEYEYKNNGYCIAHIEVEE